MRRAKLHGVQELAFIAAEVFEAGETVTYAALEARWDWVWWFADPKARTLNDVIKVESTSLDPRFRVRAISFEITAVPNPRATNVVSYLGTLSENGQQFIPMAFEETPSIERMAAVVQRRLLDSAERPVRFLGLFDVVYDTWRDEFEMKDSQCVAEFLGELDMDGEMPLTTTLLEWEILHALPPGERWDSTKIADVLGVRDYALSLPLATLKNAGYLTVGGGFMLTEKGRAIRPTPPAAPEARS